jgi:RHS repeat-associated protein
MSDAGVFFSYYQDSGSVYVSNVRFYWGSYNFFSYKGEYWDDETGTYYLRARYYDPVTSRWLSPDTHWNTSNMVYGDSPLALFNRKM